MGRPRRRTGTAELTEEQRSELLEDPWGWIDPDASYFDSDEERRRAWERHGEELTREFKADHPRRRPHAEQAYGPPGTS